VVGAVELGSDREAVEAFVVGQFWAVIDCCCGRTLTEFCFFSLFNFDRFPFMQSFHLRLLHW